MDRVRFGRALGRGARLAASTAYEAVAAATAPGPSTQPRGPQSASTSASSGVSASNSANSPTSPPARSHQSAPRMAPAKNPATRSSQSQSRKPISGTVLPRLQQGTAAARASKRSLSAPFKRATHAVSLEVTGSFFALFAIAFSVGLWRMRSLLHGGTADLCRFAAGCLAILVFAYFCISNFRQARRLQ